MSLSDCETDDAIDLWQVLMFLSFHQKTKNNTHEITACEFIQLPLTKVGLN
jgi:hypothetical protein